MDSMRSLNTSLPRTSPRHQAAQAQTQSQQQQVQPDDILSAFKQAALSVTTLYKSAASREASAKAAGYQDAIEDLVTFLDKERLGLGDGEGWRVRQWATERFDGTSAVRHESDEEEEEAPEEGRAQSAPIELERKDTLDEDLSSSVELSAPRDAVSTTAARSGDRQSTPSASQPAFTFSSRYEYPSNHDRDTPMDVTSETKPADSDNTTQPHRMGSPSASRSARSRQNRLGNTRSNNHSRSVGNVTGSKRKFPLGDFFDISGINFDGKDGSDRGGKRGRHV